MTNHNTHHTTADVRSGHEMQGIPLRHVGVTALRYPIEVWERDHAYNQHTIADFQLSVGLSARTRGTHMSRFLEAIEAHGRVLSQETLPELVDDLRTRLHADDAAIRVAFPYFIRRHAPVSGAVSSMMVHAAFACDARGERIADTTLSVTVPVQTLSPRSREIARYGAHSQRSDITLHVRGREMIWIEDMVAVADVSASSPLYPLMKREDEKWVTESAYETPVLMEDLVRNAAGHLRNDARVLWFSVEAVNHESVHGHNMWAQANSDDLVDSTD